MHRQRDHALTIATETDALADAAARGGEPISPEVLHHERRALDEVGNDWLDRVGPMHWTGNRTRSLRVVRVISPLATPVSAA